jgi:tetratricopeptide (TPR) repeat protein
MPKVFISYSHDTAEHKDRVLALSDRLRDDGVDCYIDQYEQSPAEGWPLWCEKQVEAADFVLVVCTETYLRRFRKEEKPKVGRGVTWEGHIITQELYNAQGKNTNFIPITFEDGEFVPLPLQSATLYRLLEGYEGLYRRLTDQPAIKAGPVGAVKPMLAREPLAMRHRAVWHVPHAKNVFFTGREKILSDVQAALAKGKNAALSGLGGVGKTRTAVEYAHRHRADYTAVLWVKAEERSTLQSDFAAIARALGLPSAAAKEQEAAVAEVKQWLDTHGGWLLILDNADDLDLAKEFLPSDPQGHVLLTTRARALGGLAERIAVEEMTSEEGALLLLRRSGLIDTARAEDQALARKISEELGGLPLALDQAGAFIEETPSSLGEYLRLYGLERGKLLSERGGRLGDHPSVTVTFSLAFETVAKKSVAAADVVRLCAFLAPDAIPEVIFTKGAADLGENLSVVASDPLGFTQALKEAGRFSLVVRDADKQTLDIHRLVQVVVQGGMDEAEKRVWAERAVKAVNSAFPNVEFANWSLCEELLPHATACAELVERWALEFREAARLLSQTAYYFSDRALLSEAEPLYLRALAIWEKTLGSDHPDFASGLNNLALLYKSQAKYNEAEPLYQRALGISEKALGPDDPKVATNLNNLAVLYDNQGKYSTAEPLYKRSLAIREKALGPDDPKVATSLNNLAMLYYNQGKYSEAEPLYKRSLAILDKTLGPGHPNVAGGLNNLAALYATQGKHSMAEPLYQGSLAIRMKALGPDHPDVAQSLNNLAELYDNQEKYSDAEQLFRRALAIWEKALGPDHPNTILVRGNLERNMKLRGG